MLAKRDRDAARSQLVQQLAAIHDVEEVRVTIVFDGKGAEISVDRPSGHATFSVVYTPSALTADDVIEHMVSNSADAGACVVATDDEGERGMVSAAGGVAMTSNDLAAWLAKVEGRQRAAIAKLRSSNRQEWKAP